MTKSTTVHHRLDWLTRDQIKQNLKRKSLQSAASKISTNAFSFFLNIASTMVLARLLTPKEFGLLAMVTAVTEFARSFKELGLGTLTVQREKITHAEVSTFFWINLIFAATLMVALITLSPALVWFYEEPRLRHICIALSSVFLFGGLSVQHRALLERQMKFGLLGGINIISNLMGYSIALVLALSGFGVWALVSCEVLAAVLYALGVWLGCRWMPSFPEKTMNIKSSLRFGADLSAFDMIQYFSRNVDRLLIGRVVGAGSLGLYTKAFQVAMMPIEQIRMVAWDIGLSPLSALQRETERFRQFYSKLLSIMSYFYMPIVMLLIISPESVILLLLGEKWISGAAILRIIAIGGFFRPVLATFQLIMVSCNDTRRYLKWGIVNSLIMILSFLIGIAWGVLGIAFAYSIASYVVLSWSLSYCLKNTPISFLMVLKNIGIPFLASLLAGIFLSLTAPYLACTKNLLNHFMSLLFILIFSYIGILLSIPTSRQQLREIWSFRKQLSIRS